MGAALHRGSVVIDRLPGVIPGGLGCYACGRDRDEEIPFCPRHWEEAGAADRAKLAALYRPGQHATGQCGRGWIATLSAVLARMGGEE